MIQGISTTEALEILKTTDPVQLLEILRRATEAREKHSGNRIKTCSIVNAKCGNCQQNCAFCAQSARSKAKIHTYPLIPAEEMYNAAKAAAEHGSHRFGIVTSGTKVVQGHDLDEICKAIRMIRKDLPIIPCASLGIMTEDTMLQLKEAGLDRYHHNLEASPSYFPEICTTRPYSSQLETVRTAKKVGFTVCSGGIIGIGESLEQRVELLETELPEPDSRNSAGRRMRNYTLGLPPRDCRDASDDARNQHPYLRRTRTESARHAVTDLRRRRRQLHDGRLSCHSGTRRPGGSPDDPRHRP